MEASDEAGRKVSGGACVRRRARRRTLAIGLALIATVLALTLSHDVERRTGTNGIPARAFLGTAGGSETLCQTGERIPADTAALRFSAIGTSHAAPPLAVTIQRGGRVVAQSARTRWEGNAIVVALPRPLRAGALADVCVHLHAGAQQAYGFRGTATYPEEAATQDGQPLPGRMHVEYLADGSGSWWSFAPTLVRRLGRGHAWSGASVALLVALLMLTSIAVSAWQLGRTES